VSPRQWRRGAERGPIPDVVITGPRSEETEPYRDHTVGQVAEALGKHPVDAMLDIAVADKLKTEFFAKPPNVRLDYLREVIDNPYVLLGVSDGGAHTKFLTAGRYPTETLAKLVRDNGLMSLEDALELGWVHLEQAGANLAALMD